MNHLTRQEQARAILERRAARVASKILQRRATSEADYLEAFNLERIDLISEIPNREALLALGRNVVGPRDDLYILDDGDSFRVYLQERGETYQEVIGASFDEARNAAIDRIIMVQGLPFTPPG
jgi:inactivated superfamily I helicase